MNVRHLCAVAGIAIAVGAVVFTQSLVTTNDYQATAIAERLVQMIPVAPKARIARLALDYRPEGRVMQGPPLTATLATQPGTDGIVLAKSVFAARRLTPPPVGTQLTLVGRKGAYQLPITGYLAWERPMGRGAVYPTAFVSPETAATLGEDWKPFRLPQLQDLAATFRSDAGRNFDRAKGLLLWAAALTALCLLVNTLFLSVEARRKELAILRMLGMTRFGVVRGVMREAFYLSLVGVGGGILLACGAVWGYVATDPALFPLGMKVSACALVGVAVFTPVLAILAAALALKPALAVKPLEAASAHTPKKRVLGMLLSLAFGFGGFVAVEVWGGSLMKSFVPSPEWPDAIVSILPRGVSSFEIEKLQNLEGVARVAELQPLQLNFAAKPNRNALLLASDWMPNFKLVAGSLDVCAPETCVITEMMARAHTLQVGDEIRLDGGRNQELALKIVGIVDLNWHLVTSRGLVRGLNRMPVNTDGPVFVSFDTLAAVDARPAFHVPMTHLWLDYEPAFLNVHGVFEAGRLVEQAIAVVLQTETNTVRLHARDEIADGTLAHGDQLIGSMARVPFIFVAVASLGFIALLVARVEARKREFAVLRAVGATRGDLAQELVREAAAVAEKGLFYGFVGGVGIGWLFTFVTRQAMANWGIPPAFAIPWGPICLGAVGAFALALLIVVPTSLILIRAKRVGLS